jgi:hypothetical protein
MIKFLLTLKHKFMTKHKETKHKADEIKKEELVETNTNTSETNEQPSEERAATEEEVMQMLNENEEVDMQQFSLDMMQAFIDSTAKLKSMQAQFNFPPEHHISLQVVENERLQAILEKINPTK